jgi:UDP-N-acetylglucosamine 2-epimerase
MLKIAVPNGGRSNEGLIEPILKRLRADPSFEIFQIYFDTEVGDFDNAYKYSDYVLRMGEINIDLVLCVGDRIEITAAAAAAFHHNIPIAHVYAGTVGDHNMLDAVNRHVITLWSDIQFCESEFAAEHVAALKSAAGLDYNTHVVGCTHTDDLEIVEGRVYEEPYDLILFNPLTKTDPTTIKSELIELIKTLDYSKTILWIGPNDDENRDYVIKYFSELHGDGEYTIHYASNLPRPSFLGLLKNCDRFIGNSSSMFYEAPYFLKPEQIIHIGTRNASRETITQYGASDKIVKILQDTYV